MVDAIEEMETQRELSSLSLPQRAALVTESLDPTVLDRITVHLHPGEVGLLLLSRALLGPVSESVRNRVLAEFTADVRRAAEAKREPRPSQS